MRSRLFDKVKAIGIPALAVLAGLLAWAALAQLYPSFILPGPLEVWGRFWRLQGGDGWGKHLVATLSPTLQGFALAVVGGTATGYLLSRIRLLRQLFWPYLVAIQSTPTVALLPLLIIWLGSGHLTKLILITITAFFPMLVVAMRAFGAVPSVFGELMQTLRARGWQRFRKLEFPHALPELFGGMRVSLSFALIGTVVAEFISSRAGLGYLINVGRGFLDTPLVFAALLLLVITGILSQWALRQLEKFVLSLR